jgi:hypothetical protein
MKWMLSKLEEDDKISGIGKGLYWVTEFDESGKNLDSTINFSSTGGQYFKTLSGATEHITEIENSLLLEELLDVDSTGRQNL